MLQDNELRAYNKRGLLPGPVETEEGFLERVSLVQKIETPPNALTEEEWKQAHQITEKLFDFSVDWVKAFYNDKGLPFWEGAATWIEKAPLIQLKSTFRKKSRFSLYRKEEILAHESVHAARMAYHSLRFEEHFAFLTSKSAFRKIFGPLFRYPWESALLLLLLLVSLGAQAASFYWPEAFWLNTLMLLPWAALTFGLLRLTLTRYTLLRCRQNLQPLAQDTLPILVRLTDQEIALFAKSSPQKIQEYIEREKAKTLRWRMLAMIYFS